MTENLSTGYIKIFRSIKKNWIWDDPIKLKWWIDILLDVNYADRKILIGETVIECKRGQSINSLETWAKRWRTNKSKVRRFLYLLKNDHMVVLENVQKTTRLTVCNYDSYNDWRNDSETILKTQRNGSETRVKPNNKEKKVKKEEVCTHTTFFEKEIAINIADTLIEKYKRLTSHLMGDNGEKRVYCNILKMQQLVTFAEYKKLHEVSRELSVPILDVLNEMENKPKSLAKYSSVYLTALNWMKTIAKSKENV
jgi:hypothetical protein